MAGAGPKPEEGRGSRCEREPRKKTQERMRQAQSEKMRPKEIRLVKMGRGGEGG